MDSRKKAQYRFITQSDRISSAKKKENGRDFILSVDKRLKPHPTCTVMV